MFVKSTFKMVINKLCIYMIIISTSLVIHIYLLFVINDKLMSIYVLVLFCFELASFKFEMLWSKLDLLNFFDLFQIAFKTIRSTCKDAYKSALELKFCQNLKNK